jgi:predicted dehydrogenase
VPDRRLEHLINWRLYRETSDGLPEELGSHAIDLATWIFEEQPQDIISTTSIVVAVQQDAIFL